MSSIKPKLTLTIEIDPDKQEITYNGVSEIGTDVVKYGDKIINAQSEAVHIHAIVFKDWIKHLEKYEDLFGC